MMYLRWISIGLSSALITVAVGLGNPTAAQVPPVYLSLRQRVVDFFNRDDVEDRSRGQTGGSRTGLPDDVTVDICILTPGRNEVVWHQQPLLVMQGTPDRMEIQGGSLRTRLWDDAIDPNADWVQAKVGPEPLQPGDRYHWMFYQRLSPSSDPTRVYVLPFQVMAPGPERDQITTDLERLNGELDQAGVNAEAQAQAQADYFMAQDLPADALQVLFSVDSPSPEFATLQAETVETICSFPLGL